MPGEKGVYNVSRKSVVASAPHIKKIPAEIPPHKVIEYGYSLEYTRGN